MAANVRIYNYLSISVTVVNFRIAKGLKCGWKNEKIYRTIKLSYKKRKYYYIFLLSDFLYADNEFRLYHDYVFIVRKLSLSVWDNFLESPFVFIPFFNGYSFTSCYKEHFFNVAETVLAIVYSGLYCGIYCKFFCRWRLFIYYWDVIWYEPDESHIWIVR